MRDHQHGDQARRCIGEFRDEAARDVEDNVGLRPWTYQPEWLKRKAPLDRYEDDREHDEADEDLQANGSRHSGPVLRLCSLYQAGRRERSTLCGKLRSSVSIR
jgi:hypothetical protein